MKKLFAILLIGFLFVSVGYSLGCQDESPPWHQSQLVLSQDNAVDANQTAVVSYHTLFNSYEAGDNCTQVVMPAEIRENESIPLCKIAYLNYSGYMIDTNPTNYNSYTRDLYINKIPNFKNHKTDNYLEGKFVV